MSGINSGGIVVLGLMFTGIAASILTLLIFVGLKLFKIISWGWIWVTSPGWILICILIVVSIILSLVYKK